MTFIICYYRGYADLGAKVLGHHLYPPNPNTEEISPHVNLSLPAKNLDVSLLYDHLTPVSPGQWVSLGKNCLGGLRSIIPLCIYPWPDYSGCSALMWWKSREDGYNKNTESQNDEVGRDLCRSYWPNCSSRVTQSRLSRTMSRRL